MTTTGDADPRLLRAIRELDEEKRRRIAAEREASMLRAAIARMMAEKQAADAKAAAP